MLKRRQAAGLGRKGCSVVTDPTLAHSHFGPFPLWPIPTLVHSHVGPFPLPARRAACLERKGCVVVAHAAVLAVAEQKAWEHLRGTAYANREWTLKWESPKWEQLRGTAYAIQCYPAADDHCPRWTYCTACAFCRLRAVCLSEKGHRGREGRVEGYKLVERGRILHRQSKLNTRANRNSTTAHLRMNESPQWRQFSSANTGRRTDGPERYWKSTQERL